MSLTEEEQGAPGTGAEHDPSATEVAREGGGAGERSSADATESRRMGLVTALLLVLTAAAMAAALFLIRRP